MDMRKIISVKQWGGWVLSLLLVWLVGGSVCQAGSGDEVLAYFSVNASGRQELYEFAVAKLGADKASESDKARVQRNLQQVANMAGLSTEDWRFLVSDNSKFNAYALPGYIFVITQGAVDELTDAEMQVILAHELAHEMLGHPTAAIKRSPMSMKYLRRAGKKKTVPRHIHLLIIGKLWRCLWYGSRRKKPQIYGQQSCFQPMILI